jgi:hypothetical protein
MMWSFECWEAGHMVWESGAASIGNGKAALCYKLHKLWTRACLTTQIILYVIVHNFNCAFSARVIMKSLSFQYNIKVITSMLCRSMCLDVRVIIIFVDYYLQCTVRDWCRRKTHCCSTCPWIRRQWQTLRYSIMAPNVTAKLLARLLRIRKVGPEFKSRHGNRLFWGLCGF